MSKRNILIIEDEKLNADRLKRLLNEIDVNNTVIDVLDNVFDSIQWFLHHPHPDLVLMDIRLSDGLSFEILEKINIECPIIFTTAYDEYAVRAFKYNSIDYLLKPIEKEELQAALNKLSSRTSQNLNSNTLQGLLNFMQPKDFRNRFLLPYKDGYQTIQVEDIIYFYSELKITHAKLKTAESTIVPQTLEELEHQLNPKLFFRANRQFIIHVDAIKQLHNYFNGKLKIELKNNDKTEIIVSREKAQSIKNWLDF